MKNFADCVFKVLRAFMVCVVLGTVSCEWHDEAPTFIADIDGDVIVEAEGGTVVVTVCTDIDYVVEVPVEAQTWIAAADTRAVRMEKLTFVVSKNETEVERSATVRLVDGNGVELHGISFIQSAAIPETPFDPANAIEFADPNVKLICILHWDKNEDGELSYEEAASVTSLDSKFRFSSIISFTELQFFTGLDVIGYHEFHDCLSLVKITLPEQITAIYGSAFRNCGNLVDIVIPDEVISIGDDAFSQCVMLTEVAVGKSVRFIERRVFEGCVSLANITFPDSAMEFGSDVFYGCESLKSIVIPDGTVSIACQMFQDCISLTEVTIPGSVTSIVAGAFSHCKNLKSISIPDSVTSIGAAAFERCDRLEEVTIPDGVSIVEDATFRECYSLTEIVIPGSVEFMGNFAFCDCMALKSMTIPENVTWIGTGAFEGCRSLASLYCRPTVPPEIAYGVFDLASPELTVFVPAASVDVYKAAENWDEYQSMIAGYDFL